MDLAVPKVTLIITTRCNLQCKLCCEYVPQNKPFPDMTVDEERAILRALFKVINHVTTLHLSGGGEPFLHPRLDELIDIAFDYAENFDRFMLFTNCCVPVSDRLFNALKKHGNKVIIQCSRYGINPEREDEVISRLQETGAKLKIEKYYGENQSFGGWVDFGKWESYKRSKTELEHIFSNCAVTRDMHGNWRTRDGKLHWCSRSQRGTELGLLPDFTDDYIDLLDDSMTIEEKQNRIMAIINAGYLHACDWCSGHQGTTDMNLRFKAAEQI